MAFWRDGSGRVAISFIGEGGSSLGEWHEAINLCAARRLPAIFCVENNQTALSTPVADQSAVRVFADKAAGYGMPGHHDRRHRPRRRLPPRSRGPPSARAAGQGPALIETVSMRMCGHAHHDDMLYLGRDPQPSWDVRAAHRAGLRQPRALRLLGRARSDRRSTRRGCRTQGIITAGDLDRFKREAEAIVEEQARAVIDAPWPEPVAGGRRRVRERDAARARRGAGSGGTSDRRERRDAEQRRLCELRGLRGSTWIGRTGAAVRPEGPHVPRRGDARRRRRAAKRSARVRLRRGRRRQLRQRVPAAAPAAEGVRRSHHQLAAGRRRRARRLRRRGAGRPAADRRDPVQRLRRHRLQPAREQRREDPLPLGRQRADGGADAVGRAASRRAVSLAEHRAVVLPDRRAEDRRALDAARRARADGVGRRRSGSGALLRAHRALSRSAHQAGARRRAAGRRFRSAAPRCAAPATTSRSSRTAPTSTSGCASPRSSRRTASRRACSICAAWCRSIGRRCSRVARRCHKVLIIHEDSRTGGIGESLAAIVQEEAFESLDAPVRIVGALDTPVPYSPSLEDFYLPSEAQIERAARLLIDY